MAHTPDRSNQRTPTYNVVVKNTGEVISSGHSSRAAARQTRSALQRDKKFAKVALEIATVPADISRHKPHPAHTRHGQRQMGETDRHPPQYT